MSLSELQKLCEAAAPHLHLLPDIREEKLHSQFRTVWEPAKQLQFELDSLVAELQQAPCCATAVILVDIMADRNHLEHLDAKLFSKKLEQLLYTFYFSYPVITWILLASFPKAACLFSYSDFIYYVVGELVRCHWKFSPHPRLTGSHKIPLPLSRACAKYMLWQQVLYLPGEKIDPLHKEICEKLFGSFQPEQADLRQSISSPHLLITLMRHVNREGYREIAEMLPASSQQINPYTWLVSGEKGYNTNLLIDAHAMAMLTLELAARKDRKTLIYYYSVYLMQAAEVKVGVADAIASFAAILTKQEQWPNHVPFFKKMLQSLNWNMSIQEVSSIITAICCGLHIPDDLEEAIFNNRDWVHLYKTEQGTFIAQAALQSYESAVQGVRSSWIPKWGSEDEEAPQGFSKMQEKVLWWILGYLKMDAIEEICQTSRYSNILRSVIRSMFEKATRTGFGDQRVDANLLLSTVSLADVFCYAELVATQTLRLPERRIFRNRVSSLARVGKALPSLCREIYAAATYLRSKLGAEFYRAMLSQLSSPEELLLDASQAPSLLRLLIEELRLDLTSVDPLMFVREASVRYFGLRKGL